MTSPLVSVQWLLEHLNDVIVLDASPESNVSGIVPEHTTIRIPSARPFDIKQCFTRLDCEVPNMLPLAADFQKNAQSLGICNSSTLVVYDNLGIYTSARAWWMFRAMGFERVFVLDGGLSEWVNQSCSTESIQQETYARGDFEVQFKAMLVRDYSEVSEALNNRHSTIIDARGLGRFNGLSPEPREGLRSGHIPTSINLPYKDVLSQGKMKAIADLKLLFREIDPEKPLIFTCGSGLTACIVMLASELINKAPKAVYDGSWSEWGARYELPVEISDE